MTTSTAPQGTGPAARGLARKAALFCLLVAATGCRTRLPGPEHDWYAFAGPSALPQVGVSAGAGRIVGRTELSDWAVEAEGTFQFLDDKEVLDDGNPRSGDYTQARLGVRRFLSPGHRRAAFAGFGLVFLHAEAGDGEPLILEPAGDYYGVYGQVGFLTRLSPRWSLGPEFRLLVVGGHGVQVVPQLAWQFVLRF